MLDFLIDAPRCDGAHCRSGRECDMSCAAANEREDMRRGMQCFAWTLIFSVCAVAFLAGMFAIPLLPWGTQ
jgi:hypothetical protein